MAQDVLALSEQDNEEEQRRQTKNKLFEMAKSAAKYTAAGAGLVGATFAGAGAEELMLRRANAYYGPLNNPKATQLTNDIISAHMKATGLPYPEIIEPPPGSGERVKQGVYIPRFIANPLNKTLREAGLNIGKGGGVVMPNTANNFVLAHELGHRAQDYRPIAGPVQTIGNLVASPFISYPVIHAISSQAKSNTEALVKGIAANYAMHLPRIASEIMATRSANQYISSKGTRPSALTSALQPVGYMVAPLIEAAIPVITGRVHRFLADKIEEMKNKKKASESPSNSSPPELPQ